MRVVGFIINDWQLSGIWTGVDRRRLHRVGASTRTAAATSTSPDRPTSAPASRRRRSRERLQQRSVPAVQHRRLRGSDGGQRRPRVRQRLSARLLPERARPVDCAQHPPRRRPEHPGARGHVQRAESGDHHRPQYDDEPSQSEQPDGDHEPAVRSGRRRSSTSRSRPRGAGFGVANNYQDPRTVQMQIRFSF